MKILAIETSCDETAIAVLSCNENTNQIKLLSNVVSSQIKLHAKWGGVVPNLAAREHLKNVTLVLDEALKDCGIILDEIDLIAVTKGPGLIPALLIGTNAAKALSYAKKIPLLGIHHIEGHLYAHTIGGNAKNIKFPLLALTVSGGHTQIILMRDHLQYEIIGQTQDDAAGEAFDKVAKMLGLGYPGGPIVSSYAKKFENKKKEITDIVLKTELEAIEFPRPMLMSGNFNFSFSGLKTSVSYFFQAVQKKNLSDENLELYKMAICKAFQDATVDVLVKKTNKATATFSPKTVILAGGVSANLFLQKTLEEEINKNFPTICFLKPELKFCGDNAAMIGAAAFVRYQKLKENGQLEKLKNEWKDLEANSNLKLENL
jgi:N6-L-threonylcarbamoyladenine synthase